MVKIGLIGAGFMGRTHAQAYTRCTDAAIKRVCDAQFNRAETLANDVGAQPSTSFDEIIGDPEIDLVDVCLPTPYHTGHAIRALEAGKHVLVEKPLALSLPEIDAILAAARLSDRFLMVGHVLRFSA